MPATDTLRIEELLRHADWVKGLAHRLVSDAARADDLVQETWLRALERPPRHAENLRGWLGRVVTHLARSGGRAEARRVRREREAARPEARPPADELVTEATLSRELVDTLLALPEPYRGVLLLRYFRDLSPTRIARELGRPVATVKTQLQRGLALMRERLDARYGDRRSWCLALLPLARAGMPAAGAGGLAVPAAAVLLALVAGWSAARWLRAPAAAPALQGREVARADQSARAEDAPDSSEETFERSAAIGERGAREQLALGPDAAVSDRSTFLLRGRLVDLEGRGLAGVELEWVDPGELRWADAARTVVTGADTWVRVPPELLRELRADPRALERFARERFRRPDLALALLTGSPPPRHRVRTGPLGAFELRVPELGFELVARGSEWSVLGRSALRGDEDGRQAWFAARPRTLVGRVLDARGEPAVDVEVRASASYPQEITELLALGRGFKSTEERARTDAAGRFRIDGAGLGARFTLSAERAEGERASTTLEPVDEPVFQDELELELRLSPLPPPPPLLTGRVLLPSGAPAPRATVVLGDSMTTTDAEGRFALEVRALEGELYAARAGLGIASASWRLAEPLERSSPVQLELRGPDLRLPERSLALEGRVVDRAGNPLAGVELRLLDAVDLPRVAYSLEDLAAGRTSGFLVTDADGRFRIEGLLARDYRIAFGPAGTPQRSRAFVAGTVGIELVAEE